MRKTKIVCTLGPASWSKPVIKNLIAAGMDVARLNFSHDTQRRHRKTIETIRAAAQEADKDIAILQDLSGPKIRVGVVKDDTVLKVGQALTITPRKITGDSSRISMNYPKLADEVSLGDIILIADGTILLRVASIKGGDIQCTVVVGGSLSSHKGINVPSADLSIPTVTEKDKKDIAFGIESGIDIISLSFVRSAADVADAKKSIAEHGADIPVIAKIETQKALENIDNIIDEAYGIMVARGDLGVETPFEKIPLIQRKIIEKTNAQAKPVITATQVLMSMVTHSRPTRAEVTDVASAVIAGTDALMLSEETAIGAYPVESTEALSRISTAIESETSYESIRPRHDSEAGHISPAIARAACMIAQDVDAVAIVIPTRSGASARFVESHRPRQPIIAITPDRAVSRRLALSSGIYPFISETKLDSDNALKTAMAVAPDFDFWSPDRTVVITSGPRTGKIGKTDRIKVQRIK